jgi:hypothetical protein
MMYRGTVSAVTKDEIVLTKATKERCVTHRAPILGDVPYIGPFFSRTTSTSEEAGRVQVPIAKVTWLDVRADKAPPDGIERIGREFR